MSGTPVVSKKIFSSDSWYGICHMKRPQCKFKSLSCLCFDKAKLSDHHASGDIVYFSMICCPHRIVVQLSGRCLTVPASKILCRESNFDLLYMKCGQSDCQRRLSIPELKIRAPQSIWNLPRMQKCHSQTQFKRGNMELTQILKFQFNFGYVIVPIKILAHYQLSVNV